MKYGNYNTIDCPIQHIDEAEAWLSERIDEIEGCYVIKIMNSHDFGPYPSFEVFMPNEFEYVHDEEDEAGIARYEKCIAKLNSVEQKYYKKFSKWL